MIDPPPVPPEPIHGVSAPGESRRPRLLIVAFGSSIHTRHLLEAVDGLGWEARLFRSAPDLAPVGLPCPVVGAPGPLVDGRARSFLERSAELAGVIDDWRPDLVHSHELQHAGYLTLGARSGARLPFPGWIASSWGSDLSWYVRYESHRAWLRALLASCDALGAECHRDVAIARSLGFSGRILPIAPISAGFDLAALEPLRAPGPSSSRSAIMVKAAEQWVYRGGVALEALSRCSRWLEGREWIVTRAGPKTRPEIERLCRDAGGSLTILDGVPWTDVMRGFGRARVALSLSSTDGLCTSFLEALVMGAFPVQSEGSCGAELVEPNVGACFVPGEDAAAAAAAVERALLDDELVDRAERSNRIVARAHLDRAIVAETIRGGYRTMLAEISRGRRR